MNKLVIPSLLLGVVMIAGAFAFVPVQEASTVHLTATTILGTDGVGINSIALNAIGVGDMIEAAIDADAVATDAVDEIQTLQIETISDADTSGNTLSCTSNSAFLVHYNLSGIVDSETVTIAGTAIAPDAFTVVGVTAGSLGTSSSGTIGGATDQTITFTSDAATANIILTIEAPTGATALCA